MNPIILMLLITIGCIGIIYGVSMLLAHLLIKILEKNEKKVLRDHFSIDIIVKLWYYITTMKTDNKKEGFKCQ